jgi:RNA polymerase sigma-70 factor (ECF subfamily)
MLSQMIRRTTATPKLDIEILAQAHYDAVWKFCYRRVGHDNASDATQETFLVAVRRADSFRGDATPLTWLFGIALNVCRSMQRSKKIEIPLDQLGESQNPNGHPPSAQVLQLRAAMAKLAPDQQEIIILHEIEEMTHSEIGAVLGIPEGTAKSRVFYALKALRVHFGREGETQ